MPPSPDTEQRPLPTPVLMPWEDAALSFVARFVGTFGNALTPVRGVPALCSGPTLPAWSFAVLSALPLMLAWGIIPFTHTLQFGPAGQITPTAEAATIPLWVDVTKSMAIGFGFTLLSQLAWALPFVSLLRAFSHPRVPPELARIIGVRFVLYRAWLLPFAMLAADLLVWLVAPQLALSFAAALQVVVLITTIVGAQATASALGASILGALAVALVPSIMREVVQLTLSHYMGQLLPHLPQPGG